MILVDVWIFTPFVAILVLAGIRSLPKEPFEASAVDGASWFYMFRRLMLPMMWPYILVAVIFRFMDCLKIFDHVFVLTAGGPGDATRTLQIGAYEDSIINLQVLAGQHVHVPAVGDRVPHRPLPGERAGQGPAARRRNGGLSMAEGADAGPAAALAGHGRRRPALVVWFVFSLFPLRLDGAAGAEDAGRADHAPTSRSRRRWRTSAPCFTDEGSA